jgi:hypothetical protein
MAPAGGYAADKLLLSLHTEADNVRRTKCVGTPVDGRQVEVLLLNVMV